MSILQLNRQAHVALGTVEKSSSTADPAYPAAIAVVLIPVFVVEEIADETRVFAETAVTVLASGLHRLTGVAQDAYQLRDFLSVHRVSLPFVVAESTRVYFVAAGRHEFGLSLVVLAAVIVAGSPVGGRFFLFGRGRAFADGLRFVVTLHRVLLIPKFLPLSPPPSPVSHRLTRPFQIFSPRVRLTPPGTQFVCLINTLATIRTGWRTK